MERQTPLYVDQIEPGNFLENTLRQELLGIPVDAVDFCDAVEIVSNLVDKKSTALVFTPNAEIIVKAHDDNEFLQILQSADLIVPDGSSILWAAKVLKKPLKARVTGIDLMQLLLKEAEKKGWSVYFLGAKPDVVEKAAINVQRKLPKLNICGYHHGYFDDNYLPLQQINEAKPDLLFVGMGAPRQERWLYTNKNQIQCGVAMGVGGSFDVLSGTTKRAPVWMQKRGLEWLYRYLREPKRLKRSIMLPRFVGLVIAEKWRIVRGGD